MYGLIGKMKIAAGQRSAVTQLLLDATGSMPGCLSYIVAEDPTDPDGIWITEAWESKESHLASLRLPSVQHAIALAKPHITGFGDRFETVPVGGFGLGSAG
jgi:quinol monooxygenase YgiN